jgi:hypothetical protein
VTAQYLGLALFIFSVMVLGCFSFSRYAPTAPLAFRPLGKTPLSPRAATMSRLWVQIAVVVVLGGAAVGIILAAQRGPDDKSWAYATLATLLGYCLKG